MNFFLIYKSALKLVFYALNSSVFFKKKKKIGDHFHSNVEIMILLYKKKGKIMYKNKTSYVFNFHVNFTGSEYIGPIYKNF